MGEFPLNSRIFFWKLHVTENSLSRLQTSHGEKQQRSLEKWKVQHRTGWVPENYLSERKPKNNKPDIFQSPLDHLSVTGCWVPHCQLSEANVWDEDNCCWDQVNYSHLQVWHESQGFVFLEMSTTFFTPMWFPQKNKQYFN